MSSRPAFLALAILSVFLNLPRAHSDSFARPEMVYGTDDRDTFVESPSVFESRLAGATAGKISFSRLLSASSDGRYAGWGTTTIQTIPLGKKKNLCAGERYFNEPTAATCTGFLVAPDLLVTAGHCMEDLDDCNLNAWVFGFDNHALFSQNTVTVPTHDIYLCKQVLAQVLDRTTQTDYAVVQLDHPVLGRAPLKVRTTGTILSGEWVTMAGHPSGMTQKISRNAVVRFSSPLDPFFVTNLDSFAGNSGSPVMNAASGIVEGILVRGDTDYIDDPLKNCFHANRCTADSCRGEDVSKITTVKNLNLMIQDSYRRNR